MASLNSLATLIALQAQPSKATAPVLDFHAVRGLDVDSVPRFDEIRNDMHMIGVHARAAQNQSVAIRSSLMIPYDLTAALYPHTLIPLLQGVGFVANTPTGTAPEYTYQLVKSDASAALYLNALLAYDSGANRFWRQIFDLRFRSLTINATNQGLQVQVSGMGLDEDEGAGTETIISESPIPLVPFTGGFTWGTYDFGKPRDHSITIERPYEEDDQRLHSRYRDDNQELSYAITGQMRGLTLNETVFKRLFYGGAAGTEPSFTMLTDSFAFKWESEQDIPGGATPFSVEMQVRKAELMMTNLRAAGNSIMRADLTWRAIDDVAGAPVKVIVKTDSNEYRADATLYTNAGGGVAFPTSVA